MCWRLGSRAHVVPTIGRDGVESVISVRRTLKSPCDGDHIRECVRMPPSGVALETNGPIRRVIVFHDYPYEDIQLAARLGSRTRASRGRALSGSRSAPPGCYLRPRSLGLGFKEPKLATGSAISACWSSSSPSHQKTPQRRRVMRSKQSFELKWKGPEDQTLRLSVTPPPANSLISRASPFPLDPGHSTLAESLVCRAPNWGECWSRRGTS